MAAIPEAAAVALEPLFSDAICAVAEARPKGPNELAAFVAAASARIARVPVKPAASTSMCDAAVQCSIPWLGHRSHEQLPARTLITGESSSPTPTAATYLQQHGHTIALEEQLDRCLRSVSAQAKDRQPQSASEWQRLAAMELMRECGLSEAPARADATMQCTVPWCSHSV